MSTMASFTPVRIGRLLACVLLQVALLLAVPPAFASLGPPCHHHSHVPHAAAEPVTAGHAEADHGSSSPACDPCGHCLTCCLGGCTAAWLSPSGSIGLAAALFRTVHFTPELTWWSLGQSALPALPPPRRIA